MLLEWTQAAVPGSCSLQRTCRPCCICCFLQKKQCSVASHWVTGLGSLSSSAKLALDVNHADNSQAGSPRVAQDQRLGGQALCTESAGALVLQGEGVHIEPI